VQTQVEELPDSRVRLKVGVSAHDVKHAVEHAASDLAASAKIPGFRKGKVPMPVLIQRLGKERIYAEAVESHIGGWFWNAAAQSRIRPVEQPQYGYDLPGSEDEPWEFTAEVAVQPKPELPDWRELEVPAADAEIPPEVVDDALQQLQESAAGLSVVDDRPAQPGDVVVIDLVMDGETRRDFAVELGIGRLAPEIEQRLVGMTVGANASIDVPTSETETGSVELTLKELHEKVVPPLDDELARNVSEFDTVDQLREDVEETLREQIESEFETQFRAAAVDTLVEASRLDPSGPLVEARTRELLNGLVRSVERRGVSFDAYLGLTGRTPEQLIEALRTEARQSVAREIVLEALADQAEIAVADDEVEALVREQAEEAGDDADSAIGQLRESGQFEQLREDLRLRAALDRLAGDVKRIPVDLARARDSIWTPGQEKPDPATKLWTPGSKEPV
jgi:trigger factor